MAAGIAVIVLVGAGLAYAGTHQASNTPGTPTAVPTPASLASVVDKISCARSESVAYHIHQRLNLYDNGKSVALPSAVGIPGGETVNQRCLYYLHVHSLYPDIIHVESPTQRKYTLGNFVDIWKATTGDSSPPNSPFLGHLLRATTVTAFYNGKRWTRGYRKIPLTYHAVITLEVGKPVVKPKPFTNWGQL
jgi:hypothetical protein